MARTANLQILCPDIGIFLMEWKLSSRILEGSQMNSQPLYSKKIILQDLVTNELTVQDTVSDIKYQDIIYYMQNTTKVVESRDQIYIDFLKAVSEMNNLDYTFECNYIGFVNQRTNECVQFIRQGQDKWYAEVPIMHGKGWDGYAWCSYSDSKTIVNMMRLFFEEVLWFGMLSWKMRRFKH